jgi:hypothetical protein
MLEIQALENHAFENQALENQVPIGLGWRAIGSMGNRFGTARLIRNPRR